MRLVIMAVAVIVVTMRVIIMTMLGMRTLAIESHEHETP
jgi:hypothetical protein